MEKCGLELMLHVTNLAGLRQWFAWAAGGAGRAASLPDGVALRIPVIVLLSAFILFGLSRSSLKAPYSSVLKLHPR